MTGSTPALAGPHCHGRAYPGTVAASRPPKRSTTPTRRCPGVSVCDHSPCIVSHSISWLRCRMTGVGGLDHLIDDQGIAPCPCRQRCRACRDRAPSQRSEADKHDGRQQCRRKPTHAWREHRPAGSVRFPPSSPNRSLHYTFEHPRPATGSNYCLLMAASSSVCLKYPNGHSRDVGGTTHAPIERNKRQQARRFYFV